MSKNKIDFVEVKDLILSGVDSLLPKEYYSIMFEINVVCIMKDAENQEQDEDEEVLQLEISHDTTRAYLKREIEKVII